MTITADMATALTAPPQTVGVVPLDTDRNMYYLDFMSFDEEDRDLRYIDRVMSVWAKWREWVVENGERE